MHKLPNELPQVLLPWYDKNKRDLPWRQTRDPYRIWLSEIMLQQTRVEAVKGYYARFLQALPTVEDLAKASDDQINKLWEGLGYYSRARNLKKAAIRIVEQYSGKFPGEYADVLSLPGIGPYTAGAICSIAFDQKTPAVDGNVLRLVSRLTDDPTPIDLPEYKKKVQQALKKIYPDHAGNFTQALMELGATLCGPNRKPDCESCPCKGICLGYRNATAESLPVKSPKRGRREEDLTVFVLRCGDRYALEKRPAEGLLAGLWQFPNAPGKMEISDAIAWVERNRMKVREIYRQVERKHIFTHIQWNMSGVYMELAEEGGTFAWLTADEISAQAALPTAFRQFWEVREDV